MIAISMSKTIVSAANRVKSPTKRKNGAMTSAT